MGKRPTLDGLGRIIQGSDIRSKTYMTVKGARDLGEQGFWKGKDKGKGPVGGMMLAHLRN